MLNQILSSAVWQTVGALIAIITPAIAIIGSIHKSHKPPKTKRIFYIITISLTLLLIIGTSGVIYVLSPSSQSPTTLSEQGTPVNIDFGSTAQWESYPISTSGTSACFYENSFYHDQQNGNNLSNPCMIQEQGANYENIEFHVHLQILQGDCGGIIFRANSDRSQYYGLLICRNGQVKLIKEQKPSKTDDRYTVPLKASQQLTVNSDNSYTVGIIAVGSKLEVYINQVLIPSLTSFDSSYTTGFIGVLAHADTNDTEVLFNNPVLSTR